MSDTVATNDSHPERVLAMSSETLHTTANAAIGVPVAVVWVDPAATRNVDLPALDPHPQLAAWIAQLDLALRLDLIERTSTQALLGEPVIVIAERDGWSEVRLPWQPSTLSPDGYPGWVRSAHLVQRRTDDDDSGRAIVRRSLVANARTEDGEIFELSFGTILSMVADEAETTVLRHPNGTALRVASALFDPFEPTELAEPGAPSSSASRHLLDTARLFLDLPYLWAGVSGSGVDCSGFVHLIYRAAGIRVGRDAHDQVVQGDPVELGDAAFGDPVFFENEHGVHHVGLAAAPGRMLHSPRTGRSVSDDPIASPSYAGERVISRTLIPRAVPTPSERSR
jgi:cell wall-associated NlpC family hydrolase